VMIKNDHIEYLPDISASREALRKLVIAWQICCNTPYRDYSLPSPKAERAICRIYGY